MNEQEALDQETAESAQLRDTLLTDAAIFINHYKQFKSYDSSEAKMILMMLIEKCFIDEPKNYVAAKCLTDIEQGQAVTLSELEEDDLDLPF